MTGNPKDVLMNLLFSNDERELVNLKLLRGDENISEHELCEQVHSALFQVESGLSMPMEDFPEEAFQQVNLQDLEANM